jgi:hypothetical protein
MLALTRAFSGCNENRALQGIPLDWKVVEYWLSEDTVPYPEQQPEKKPEIKWPHIPTLRDYRTISGNEFWEHFPKKDLPIAPATTVNKPALRKMLVASKDKLTIHQLRRGEKVLKDLQLGASAAQKTELPPITVKKHQLSIRKWEHANQENRQLGGNWFCGRSFCIHPSSRVQG